MDALGRSQTDSVAHALLHEYSTRNSQSNDPPAAQQASVSLQMDWSPSPERSNSTPDSQSNSHRDCALFWFSSLAVFAPPRTDSRPPTPHSSLSDCKYPQSISLPWNYCMPTYSPYSLRLASTRIISPVETHRVSACLAWSPIQSNCCRRYSCFSRSQQPNVWTPVGYASLLSSIQFFVNFDDFLFKFSSTQFFFTGFQFTTRNFQVFPKKNLIFHWKILENSLEKFIATIRNDHFWLFLFALCCLYTHATHTREVTSGSRIGSLKLDAAIAS